METLTTDTNAEIRIANERFMKAFAQSDVAGITSMYAEKGVVLPAGFELAKGKSEIESFWRKVFEMGFKQLKLDTTEVEQHDNLAIEMGNYKLYGKENQEVDHGKYIVVWKRENNQWKLEKDIWNSNITVPAPAQ